MDGSNGLTVCAIHSILLQSFQLFDALFDCFDINSLCVELTRVRKMVLITEQYCASSNLYYSSVPHPVINLLTVISLFARLSYPKVVGKSYLFCSFSMKQQPFNNIIYTREKITKNHGISDE